jgi:hypothetical protein
LVFLSYYVEFFVGKHLKGMTHLTRDVLVKTIVAEEMIGIGGEDYTKQLKETKHKWEHASSEELCRKYNQLKYTNITVEILSP